MLGLIDGRLHSVVSTAPKNKVYAISRPKADVTKVRVGKMGGQHALTLRCINSLQYNRKGFELRSDFFVAL